MSELEELCATLQGIAGDITGMAHALHQHSSQLGQAAARAAQAARSEEGGHGQGAAQAAWAFDAAAKACAAAAQHLVRSNKEAMGYVARTATGGAAGGAGSAASGGTSSATAAPASGSPSAGVLMAGDADAVADVTGVGHQEINSTLWNGSVADVEEIASRAVAFSNALDSFPVHEGTVLRGMNLSDAQVARYEPGSTVVEPGFTHASRDPDREFGGNTVFVIDSKSGRDVGQRSAVPVEQEVTFDMSSRFDVLSKEWVDDLDRGPGSTARGRWLIYLFER